MDAGTLRGQHGTGLLRMRTEESEGSEDSFSIPSPQLVEKSGVSTPEMFFYQLESELEESVDTLRPAPSNFSEKVKNWTRGLDPNSLKRYLEPIQTKKPATEQKLKHEAVLRTANLMRQRAYTPLLTMDKSANLGTKYHPAHKVVLDLGKSTETKTLRYQQSNTKPPIRIIKSSAAETGKESVRKSMKRTEIDTTLNNRLQSLSPMGQAKGSRLPQKQTGFKGKTLKPLRSLTPQLTRGSVVKNVH